MSDEKELDRCRAVLLRAQTKCESQKHIIAKLKAKIAAVEAEQDKLLNTLEHVIEYWNRDPNETAMADALWHIINTAEDAIDAARGAK